MRGFVQLPLKRAPQPPAAVHAGADVVIAGDPVDEDGGVLTFLIPAGK
jgi:hypothetical protein